MNNQEKDGALSGPIVGIIIAVVVLLIAVIGWKAISPDQHLGKEAQQRMDAMKAAQRGTR